MKYNYPAVFYSDGKAVAFHFVDREDWFLCGDNIDDAIDMAVDVLNGALLRLEREGKEIPAATPIDKVDVKPLQLVKMIHADTEKYAQELAQMNDREAIMRAENPINELLTRLGWTIKRLSDELNAPYRTVQDWKLGNSKPPSWVLPLILDKVLG